MRAQGVKKGDAKLKSHLELLHTATIGFIPASAGFRLTYASMIALWPGLWEYGEKLVVGLGMAGLIDDLCLEGERDSVLWREIIESFILLDKSKFEDRRRDVFESSGREALSFTHDADAFFRSFENRVRACLGDAETS
ncbi:MAG: hypothetical protein G01um101433_427 [Parcubacteria group bacterium Gr01-1014_33]|nr:MAG: hypothetical protein G01um101433_427 [Parcubacteria group bacterium Gr01-1014_33]